MNIAILIPTLSNGGAERVAQTIGNHYTKKGENVYYFLSGKKENIDYPVKGTIVNTKVEYAWGNNTGIVDFLWHIWCDTCKIRKLKKQYRIDVAISFLETCNYVNVLSKGREKVIPRVCSTLSKRQHEHPFLFNKRIVHFFYSKADKIIVLCKYGMRDMQEYYGIARKKMVLIPNGVAPVKEGEKQDVWEYGNKAIICAGRLTERKQQERIIRAFSYVLEREKSARLLLLGKGENLNYLKRLVATMNMKENVHFLGYSSDIEYYLEHGKLFVMASKSEGFPNAMLEAMNYGLPIVSTDCPGACKEIIGKCQQEVVVANMSYAMCKYGILTPMMPLDKPNGNPPLAAEEKVLGEAMLQILKNDEACRFYQKQSRKRAKMFQIDDVVKLWDKLIYGGQKS